MLAALQGWIYNNTMKPEELQQNDQFQPVAYDADGRPLYHHPPQPVSPAPAPVQPVETLRDSHVTIRPEQIEGHNFDPQIRAQYANEPKVIHTTRQIEPAPLNQNISDELRQKHEESVRRYPYLNLSEGEYVILDIKRHPIGMLIPISITSILIILILGFNTVYPSFMTQAGIFTMPAPAAVFGISLLLSVLAALGGAVALWVYLQNQFFMTNESVIQEIQESLFSRHEQTVSLGSIEDASFRQTGIIQTIFNYGTIRLSTEGEETTYIFHYVTNPKRQIATLNNAIEAFKNGRPVCDD